MLSTENDMSVIINIEARNIQTFAILSVCSVKATSNCNMKTDRIPKT